MPPASHRYLYRMKSPLPNIRDHSFDDVLSLEAVVKYIFKVTFTTLTVIVLQMQLSVFECQ